MKAYMAVVDQLILRIFDDAKDFFDSAIHIGTRATDEDEVHRVSVGVLADLN